ncbi:hypothetical protein NL676_028362 [Syzygium grande]|nr:hypothetical protein NL676_028362 [Syzygium grande]
MWGLQNVGYPFWGLNRASYCGLPDFELTCQDNTTVLITISNHAYRVLQINYTTQTMTVVRNDYWNTICPSNLINTTLEIASPFSYTSDTMVSNLILYYGCQASPSQTQSTMINTNFSCPNNQTTGIGYVVTKNGSDIVSHNLTTITAGCNTSVVLAAYQSGIQEIKSNLSRIVSAIDEGFGLQWTADDKCSGCLASGGQCGQVNSSGAFACYCQDKSYLSTCSGPVLPMSDNGGIQLISLLPSPISVLNSSSFFVLSLHLDFARLQETLFRSQREPVRAPN